MATPTLVCPQCRHTLEYHVTIEMLDPPVGKIDTGYCVRCERLFERIRESGTFYDSTMWPPLCRLCRQPVAVAALAAAEGDESTVLFECRVHHGEQWAWSRATERWTRSTRN